MKRTFTEKDFIDYIRNLTKSSVREKYGALAIHAVFEVPHHYLTFAAGKCLVYTIIIPTSLNMLLLIYSCIMICTIFSYS